MRRRLGVWWTVGWRRFSARCGAVVALAAVAAACRGGPSAARLALVDEVDAVLPAWDVAHLSAPLVDALDGCTDDELRTVVDVLTCHQDVDLPWSCEGGPDGCYAELSAGCWEGARLSEACLGGYDAAFGAAPGGVIAPAGCGASSGALALATATYTPQDTAAASQVTPWLPSFELLGSFSGGDAGGRALFGTSVEAGQTVCHVAFKGTDSAEDVVADLSSIFQRRCATEAGTPMGWCGEGFYTQYDALRTDGLVADVAAALDAGMCPGGLRVAGHSLGGAEASLFAVEAVLDLTPDVRVETFGEPRAFFTDDALALDGLVDKTRWVTWADPVPQVPYAWLEFGHFGDARELYATWTGAVFMTDEPVDFEPFGFDPFQHQTSTYRERLDLACP